MPRKIRRPSVNIGYEGMLRYASEVDATYGADQVVNVDERQDRGQTGIMLQHQRTTGCCGSILIEPMWRSS